MLFNVHNLSANKIDITKSDKIMKTLNIGSNVIGPGQPCFIIAEAGLNHNGDVELAKCLIEQAAQLGADAVKFQTYTPDELFPPDHPDLHQFKKVVFDQNIYLDLMATAENHNIMLLSTPFDEASVDLLDVIGITAFKIGSGEVTHHHLLRYIAEKQKTIILSTGMSTLVELDRAIAIIREAGDPPLALLHCVSAYPCPVEQAALQNITLLQQHFSYPVGFSDHTTSDLCAIAAIALGACIVEKHFTLSHHLPGWDHSFSYDPDQMKRFITLIRDTEQALKSEVKSVSSAEIPIRSIARRAIYTRCEIKHGEILKMDHLVIRRPEGPLHADQLDTVLGKKAARNIPKGAALAPDDLEL